MIKCIYAAMILILGSNLYAQQVTDCKVQLPALSGTYSGECKKGLAHGKGVAQGIDHYEGQFIKGLPEGNGIYKWADGSWYEGEWKKGMREGQGRLVKKDSVISGYWSADKYKGKALVPSYKITHSRSVARSTISKSIDSGNGVKIKIMLGGSDNTEIEDFTLAYTSGSEYRNGVTYGIEHSSLPLEVTVRYITWNQLHTVQYDVLFEFTIFDPGTWNVTIINM
jgi:hypothetical protein